MPFMTGNDLNSLKLVLLTALLLASCSDKPARRVEIIINNDYLMKSYKQYKTAWLEKRSVIEFESGASADNCDSYIKNIAESSIKEEINNQLVKSEYLVCDALALIGDGRSIKQIAEVSYGEALATRLDLTSFPSSLFMMLDDEKNIMVKVGDTNIHNESNYVMYETDDWAYKLEVVAVLDINKNGKDDWLIWLSDEAKDGNYKSYQTLVSYGVPTAGGCKAQKYY